MPSDKVATVPCRSHFNLYYKKCGFPTGPGGSKELVGVCYWWWWWCIFPEISSEIWALFRLKPSLVSSGTAGHWHGLTFQLRVYLLKWAMLSTELNSYGWDSYISRQSLLNSSNYWLLESTACHLLNIETVSIPTPPVPEHKVQTLLDIQPRVAVNQVTDFGTLQFPHL